GVVFGEGPRAAVFAGPFVALEATRSSLRPALVLTTTASTETSASSGLVGGAFSSWVSDLRACPVTADLGARGRVRPGAAFELGALVASGRAPQDPQDVTRLWAAVGLAVHGRVTVVRSLFVETSAALLFPLARDEFYFDRDLTLYTVPAAAGR